MASGKQVSPTKASKAPRGETGGLATIGYVRPPSLSVKAPRNRILRLVPATYFQTVRSVSPRSLFSLAVSLSHTNLYRDLLATLGISGEEEISSFLEDCDSFDDEFQKLKRKYFRAALKSHPDKPGGDAEKFREVRSAFETLRSIFDKKVGNSI